MNSFFGAMRHPLTQYGPVYGEVVERIGPAIGPANQIRYRVRLYHAGGSTDYGPIAPSHRRPSDTLDIGAAHPGDVCVALFKAGTQPRFFIIESVVAEGC